MSINNNGNLTRIKTFFSKILVLIRSAFSSSGTPNNRIKGNYNQIGNRNKMIFGDKNITLDGNIVINIYNSFIDGELSDQQCDDPSCDECWLWQIEIINQKVKVQLTGTAMQPILFDRPQTEGNLLTETYLSQSVEILLVLTELWINQVMKVGSLDTRSMPYMVFHCMVILENKNDLFSHGIPSLFFILCWETICQHYFPINYAELKSELIKFSNSQISDFDSEYTNFKIEYERIIKKNYQEIREKIAAGPAI